ncbi:MAG: hypothetical protein V1835_06560 [Candidatus Micrarchaeota archaeon]
MEIVIDLGLLHKLVSVEMISSLNELFGEPSWIIAPSAATKLKREKKETRFKHIHIASRKLHYKERELVAKMRGKFFMLSKEELEGIAIARNRGVIYSTNEEAAKLACRGLEVRYMTLPMLLKALWAKKILTKKGVWEIIDKMDRANLAKFEKVEKIFE